jgi:UDP-2,3-diacylglucosamine pyrophosphatase LpxH
MLKVYMLIVISDLHFSDGSSSRNISHRAFSHFFQHIKRGLREENKEIIVVFAGDTFDLLRSDYWMTVKYEEKPWAEERRRSGVGEQEAGLKKPYTKHLKTIFERILNENTASLAIIRQAEDLFQNVPVKMFIIPGNHDRMLLEIEGYKDILNEHLGDISIAEGLYENKDYGVRIRHGHEYDAYNFEDNGVPIGDINTVELFVQLPFEIKKRYPELADELRCIEDIRPQWRIFDYLGATYPEGEINRCIKEATRETIERFLKIPDVKKWIDKHDTSSLIDDADKLKYALYIFKLLPLSWAEKFLKIFSHFEIGEHHYEDMAEIEKVLYSVYGHTHTENISFLGITAESRHRYYVNTGTWRERIAASSSGMFSRYKTLTYAVFYTKEERHTEFPSFELWNGALRE